MIFPLFFFKFYILHLTLLSILVQFCVKCEDEVEVHFFVPYGCPIAPAPFVEKALIVRNQ